MLPLVLAIVGAGALIGIGEYLSTDEINTYQTTYQTNISNTTTEVYAENSTIEGLYIEPLTNQSQEATEKAEQDQGMNNLLVYGGMGLALYLAITKGGKK